METKVLLQFEFIMLLSCYESTAIINVLPDERRKNLTSIFWRLMSIAALTGLEHHTDGQCQQIIISQ